MMPGRPAGWVAWRGEDWPSCQAARRSLRAFQASPHHFQFNRFGASPVCPHAFGPPSRQTASLPSPTALWPANRQGWWRRRYLVSVALRILQVAGSRLSPGWRHIKHCS